MKINSIKIVIECILQLLDLPGIIEGAKDGKGRGRQVIAVARTCSLIFIVLDVLKPLGHKRLIEHELEGFGLRLNKQPPNITFKKKDKGGINLQTMVPLLRNILRKQFIESINIWLIIAAQDNNITILQLFQCAQSELDYDTVKMILSEYKISNADVMLRYDATSDDLIDVIEGNRIYIPCIYLLNKIGNRSDGHDNWNRNNGKKIIMNTWIFL